jgi:hypothetical protein
VDFGTKEFPKPDGEYSVTLIGKRTDPAVVAMIDKLTPYYEQALANGDTAFKALKAESRKKLGKVSANPLFTELLDQDTEEPTGDVTFKFAVKASGEYKKGPKMGKFWDTRPPIFDIKAKELTKGFRFRDREDEETMADVHVKGKPSIWGGSVGYVSFEAGIDQEGNPGYFIAGTGAAGLKLGLTAVQVTEVVSGGQQSAGDFGFGNEAEDDDEAPTTVRASGDVADEEDF